MFAPLLCILPLPAMTAMIVSDFRSRSVGVVWLAIFAICVGYRAAVENGLQQSLYNIMTNTGLLVYLGAGIIFYLRIKCRKWVNPLSGYIGSGDGLLLAAITPLYNFKTYLLFILVSLLSALCWWTWMTVYGKKQVTVPLAGVAGIVFFGWTIFNTVGI